MNDQPSIPTLEARDRITPEESARRKAAIDYARGSVRLEGFVIPAFAEAMKQRYIDGEITRSQLTSALLARYGT